MDVLTTLVAVRMVSFSSLSMTLMRKLSPCKVGLALVRVRVRVRGDRVHRVRVSVHVSMVRKGRRRRSAGPRAARG